MLNCYDLSKSPSLPHLSWASAMRHWLLRPSWGKDQAKLCIFESLICSIGGMCEGCWWRAGGCRMRAPPGGQPSAERRRAPPAVSCAGARNRAGAREIQACLHPGALEGNRGGCEALMRDMHDPTFVIRAILFVRRVLSLDHATLRASGEFPHSNYLCVIGAGSSRLADWSLGALCSCRWMQRMQGRARGPLQCCSHCWDSPSGSARRAALRQATRISCAQPSRG